MMSSKVVLPHPLGPSSVTNSPGATDVVTTSSARTGELDREVYVLLTLSISTADAS